MATPRGRTHPPSLLTVVEGALRDERLVVRGDVLVCACSGGPDSMALLHVLARLRNRFGFGLVAHGVDHGLRPDASAELDAAAAFARALGVPFGVTRVDLTHGANLMARARSARLGALRDAAARVGASAVATGHTADDRAETFLLRLLRGAGPRGLSVLPSRAPFPVDEAGGAAARGPGGRETGRGPVLSARPGGRETGRGPVPRGPWLVRPLLLARRGDVIAHLERHGIVYATDPSNLDSRFSRVRVRRELLPLLEEMSPGIVAHLCALADMLGARAQAPSEDPLAALEGLGRAQQEAVARARRLGRPSVVLRLRGGRDVEVAFRAGSIVLTERARGDGRRGRPGRLTT